MGCFGRNICLIADNCHIPLLTELQARKLHFLETNLGNAGSFRHAYELALTLPDETLVYFVEDDYLHMPVAPYLLEEGIAVADYITVYDHPDKYGPSYDYGEISKVVKTKTCHWRYSISTTMTFATQVRTLKEDQEIWWKWTDTPHPYDHEAFSELVAEGRKLAISLPGAACHTDLSYSMEIGENMIDEWAIDMMIADVSRSVESFRNPSVAAAMMQLKQQNLEKMQLLACLVQLEATAKHEVNYPYPKG